MNDDVPGVNPSLYARPLGSQRAPSWSSRHPLLAIALLSVLWYAFLHAWQLSQAHVRRTAGAQALRAYRKAIAWKLAAASMSLLVFFVSAPFADPVTMGTGEYVFGFAFLSCLVTLPVLFFPVFTRAFREHACRRDERAAGR